MKKNFKDTLNDAQLFFDQSSIEAHREMAQSDRGVEPKKLRSTVSFPLQANKQSISKSVYKYQRTSLSFRLDRSRPPSILVSSKAGNVIEAQRFKEFQDHERRMLPEYKPPKESFDIFSPTSTVQRVDPLKLDMAAGGAKKQVMEDQPQVDSSAPQETLEGNVSKDNIVGATGKLENGKSGVVDKSTGAGGRGKSNVCSLL